MSLARNVKAMAAARSSVKPSQASAIAAQAVAAGPEIEARRTDEAKRSEASDCRQRHGDTRSPATSPQSEI